MRRFFAARLVGMSQTLGDKQAAGGDASSWRGPQMGHVRLKLREFVHHGSPFGKKSLHNPLGLPTP
jgi:hypothetical protein